jgi:hypothetical protein
MLGRHVKPNFALAVLLGATALVTACTHMVQRPVECAPPSAPVGQSVLGWQRVAGTQAVTGKVASPGSPTAIPGARVSLTLLPIPAQGRPKTVQGFTDVSGAFRIDSISPARYVMAVQGIGYRPARDTVLVTRDSGIVATGILVPDNVTLDECGMIYQKVRVPWWKRN